MNKPEDLMPEDLMPGYLYWEQRIQVLVQQTASPESNSVISAMKQLCNEMMQASKRKVPTKREDGMPANAEERRLRRMLCASRHGTRAYMDDGEANVDNIDYMRLSLDEIDSAYHRFQMKKHGFVNN